MSNTRGRSLPSLAGEDLVNNADVFYEQPDGDAVILPHSILIARIMML